ncbi:hypothetical protein KKC88_04160 [Patescibacteria group bacterium]|nr:hypothetical protein [Patescibacteria group bacterium]MBU1673163.1 hypothetical protein [Patescibacteria group bacterium]MBU1964152.1 hypothetical protein [Patescibacteria group bacterium]
MPEISSQEAGAKQGAMAKAGKGAVSAVKKGSDVKDKAVDKFWEFVPGSEGEYNPIEDALGPQKGQPSLEQQATQKRAAKEKEPQKKGGGAGFAADSMGQARSLKSQKASARQSKGGIGSAVSGKSKKVAKKSVEIINRGVIWTIFIIGILGLIFPPIYLFCLFLLFLILIGAENLAKNMFINLVNFLPVKFLMPASLRSVFDGSMDFFKNDVKLRMGVFEMFIFAFMLIPLFLFLIAFVFFIVILSSFQSTCDSLGPLCDLGGKIIKWIGSLR